jgi:BioD-like phosphotransacetylase family protein
MQAGRYIERSHGMKKYLITSTRTGAGKTTVALGILLNAGEARRVAYFKPFGDNMIMRERKLCDRDAQLVIECLDLETEASRLSVAFDYETLMEDMEKEHLSSSISSAAEQLMTGADLTLIESARNFSYGAFLGFDAISLSELLGVGMLLVADGDPGLVVDKCEVVREVMQNRDVRLAGVIINNVREVDMDRTRRLAVPALEHKGIDVLGVIPHIGVLSQIDAMLVAEKLGAKVLSGERGIGKPIRKILVGAMRADTALQMRSLYEPNKLIITGGDRVDMIMTAFDTSTSCIVLTGDLVPHPRILARADELEVPMLSVPMDTYTTAQMIERIRAETRADDAEKLDLVRKIVREGIALDKI